LEKNKRKKHILQRGRKKKGEEGRKETGRIKPSETKKKKKKIWRTKKERGGEGEERLCLVCILGGER